MIKLQKRISYAYNYLVLRSGHAITYKRFKSSTYDPISGETKQFWEIIETKGILVSIKDAAFHVPEPAASQAQDILVFPLSAFTKQQDESDTPWPHPGDEILIEGKLYTPNLAGKSYAWTDPLKTLYFLAIKYAS